MLRHVATGFCRDLFPLARAPVPKVATQSVRTNYNDNKGEDRAMNAARTKGMGEGNNHQNSDGKPSSLTNKTTSDMARTDRERAAIKFTESDAYKNYRASANFYGGDDRNLPKSHNYVLAGTGIFGFFYLIFLRDDIEADGGKNLFQPVHEQIPELAIPLIQAAIEENRKHGNNTKKLEKKLQEMLSDPEKYGMNKPKLIEN